MVPWPEFGWMDTFHQLVLSEFFAIAFHPTAGKSKTQNERKIWCIRASGGRGEWLIKKYRKEPQCKRNIPFN